MRGCAGVVFAVRSDQCAAQPSTTPVPCRARRNRGVVVKEYFAARAAEGVSPLTVLDELATGCGSARVERTPALQWWLWHLMNSWITTNRTQQPKGYGVAIGPSHASPDVFRDKDSARWHILHCLGIDAIEAELAAANTEYTPLRVRLDSSSPRGKIAEGGLSVALCARLLSAAATFDGALVLPVLAGNTDAQAAV